MIKTEFDSIELLDRNIAWSSDSEKNIHTALLENSFIFVIYRHGAYKRLEFPKNQSFSIDDDCLIYDETQIRELPV